MEQVNNVTSKILKKEKNSRLYLLDIYDSKAGLLINVEKEENDIITSIKIFFDSYYSMRVTNESYILKFINDLVIPKEFDHFIYELKQTEYINWFVNQSYNTINLEIFHYVIFTEDDVVEVINDSPPMIDFDLPCLFK